MDNIKYEIKKTYSVISRNINNYYKLVQLVSWNNGTPQIEIREWNSIDKTPGLGIRFTDQEVMDIITVLKQNSTDLNKIVYEKTINTHYDGKFNFKWKIINPLPYIRLNSFCGLQKQINLALMEIYYDIPGKYPVYIEQITQGPNYPKFDIRCWGNNGMPTSQGITLHILEAERVIKELESYVIDYISPVFKDFDNRISITDAIRERISNNEEWFNSLSVGHNCLPSNYDIVDLDVIILNENIWIDSISKIFLFKDADFSFTIQSRSDKDKIKQFKIKAYGSGKFDDDIGKLYSLKFEYKKPIEFIFLK
jgi:hypothetical protein